MGERRREGWNGGRNGITEVEDFSNGVTIFVGMVKNAWTLVNVLVSMKGWNFLLEVFLL